MSASFPVPDMQNLPLHIAKRIGRLSEYQLGNGVETVNMFKGHLNTLIALHKYSISFLDEERISVALRSELKKIATQKNQLVNDFMAKSANPDFTFKPRDFLAASIAMQNGHVVAAIQLMASALA